MVCVRIACLYCSACGLVSVTRVVVLVFAAFGATNCCRVVAGGVVLFLCFFWHSVFLYLSICRFTPFFYYPFFLPNVILNESP